MAKLTKLTDVERTEIITDLVTNCDCWKNSGDLEILKGFTDAKLVALNDHVEKEKQAIAVANAAVNGITDDVTGKAYRVNPETAKWEKRPLANASEDEAKPAKKKKGFPVDEEEEDDEDEKYRKAEVAKRLKGKATENEETKKPKTFDDLVRSAPAEVQNRFGQLQQIEQREKDKAIDRLLINISAGEKRIHHERLQSKPLDELQYLVSLIPPVAVPEEVEGTVPTRNQRRVSAPNADDDMLALPTMNWQEVSNDNQKQSSAAQIENADVSRNEAEEWEEFIRTTPPRFRHMVQNVTAIEARERRKLIDDLVANVTDEDAEKRLRARLEHKPIDELKDLQSLPSRREPSPRPNYFGSSAAPLSNTRPNEANEDLLPLPTMDWRKQG